MKKIGRLSVQILLILLLVFCFAACTDDSSDNLQSDIKQYTDNNVINQFINNYNNIADKEIKNIEASASGNDKYSFSIGENYGEILFNEEDGIFVTVNVDYEDVSMENLKDIFCNMVTILDENVNKNDAETTYDTLIDNNLLVENDSIGTVTYMFVPSVELSNGMSPGHFEISSAEYNGE